MRRRRRTKGRGSSLAAWGSPTLGLLAESPDKNTFGILGSDCVRRRTKGRGSSLAAWGSPTLGLLAESPDKNTFGILGSDCVRNLPQTAVTEHSNDSELILVPSNVRWQPLNSPYRNSPVFPRGNRLRATV